MTPYKLPKFYDAVSVSLFVRAALIWCCRKKDIAAPTVVTLFDVMVHTINRIEMTIAISEPNGAFH